MLTKTRTTKSTARSPLVEPTLLLAFELGERTWKLGFTTENLGSGRTRREIPARGPLTG